MTDVDSGRMMLKIVQGKGKKDRYVALSPSLLEILRKYWKGHRPSTWLFPNAKALYPKATKLMITADCGGSNGYRNRLWKLELARLAKRIGLEIHVCHLPPGTSKWNKIEHRLFSFISMNWRGRPLSSYSVIVDTIAATTTRTGLTVKSELDPGVYAKGIEVSSEIFEKIPITHKTSRPELNYVIKTSFKL